jgi:hypothetical protein
VGQMVFEHNSPGSRIKWGKLYDSGNQSTYPMQLISQGSSAYLEMNTGSMRAPIFYDYDDISYYLDMNSTSDSAGRIRGGILFGPNTTWGAYLRVGGNGDPDTSYANVAATNGNLHLDCKAGYSMYLNNYANGNIYLNGGTYYISSNGSQYNGNAASATNADTVDGYHASTSTIGNYIVVRDANGYIFGNYLNMTDDGNPGAGTAITSFITKQGDNYYRSVSPTNAMVSIRGVASGTWGISITGSAGSAGSVAWGNVTGKPSNIYYYQGFTLDANTMDTNASGFTYAVNAPHTGPIERIGDSNYSLQFNATYHGGGNSISYRTRNGDIATFNPWRAIWHDGNFTPGSYLPLAGGTMSGAINMGGNQINNVTEIYNNSWFRNNNVNQGLYNQSSGNHFYSGTASRWNITGASNNAVKLLFRNTHESTIFGSVYADSSPAIGFLSADENWALRVDASKNVQIYGTDLTVGNSTSSNIYMTDTDETTRRIHCNSGRIGFLNSANGWGAYCDNTGNWFSDFSVRAPIFYDSNDTAYYLDPNGTSNLNKFSAFTMSYNDMNSMSANSPYAARYAGSAGYRNGTMGYGQTDFNVMFSNWGSGFIDSWSSPANAPGGSSHYVGLQGFHYNYENGSQAYGFQMACAGEVTNRYFWRNAWPNLNAWVEMLHSGNYNSYAPTLTGTGASGTWAISVTGSSGSSGSVSGLTLTSSSNGINPDSVTQNQLGYNTSVNLFGQTDGGLYSSAYSSAWIHQIYGDFRTGQIAIRGKLSGTWQAWRVVLDSSNYTGYAPTLTGGGASGTWGISISGNSANTNSISSAVGGAYTWTGINYFETNNGGQAVNNSNSAKLQAYSSGNNSAFMSFHRGGYYAVNFGLDDDNYMRIGGWSAAANRWQLNLSTGATTIPGIAYSQGVDTGNGDLQWGGAERQIGRYRYLWYGYWSMWFDLIGGTGGGNLIYADTLYATYGSVSDIRYKKEVTPSTYGLSEVLKMNTIKYKYDLPIEKRSGNDPNFHIGFSAQDMLEIVPEAVMYDKNRGVYAIANGELIPVLVNSIKELKAEINELKLILNK